MKKFLFAWIMSVLSGLMLLAHAQDTTVVRVAAASDLKFALEELTARYEKQTGQNITLVFGSSGQFTTQIQQGAPFQIFMSADENFVYKLSDAGKTADRGKVYALGRIGIFTPNGSPLKADGSLKDLSASLQDGRLQKLAIANPEHAPYGERAKQVLQNTRLWNAVQSKLILGENISQAAQFALSGSAQAGIIAQSLAVAPAFADKGRFDLIDAKNHQPLIQRMVLIKPVSAAAQLFYDYLGSAPAQAVLSRYGFTMP
jgi:molybdate transport system substrate-binding protein